jgi:hypothetical protein
LSFDFKCFFKEQRQCLVYPFRENQISLSSKMDIHLMQRFFLFQLSTGWPDLGTFLPVGRLFTLGSSLYNTKSSTISTISSQIY